MDEGYRSTSKEPEGICEVYDRTSEILSNLSLLHSTHTVATARTNIPFPWDDSNAETNWDSRGDTLEMPIEPFVTDSTLPFRFNYLSWFHSGDVRYPATDRQTNKLSSIHSEAEFAMHHQEPDYAHHKHYLHQHHRHYAIHQAFNLIPLTSLEHDLSMSISERKLSTQSSQDESADLDSRNSGDGPHFRDDYPHHHQYFHHYSHHHHHGHFKGEVSTILISSLENTDRQSNNVNVSQGNWARSTQEKLLQSDGIQQNGDSLTDFQDALFRRRLRIMDWLDGVQETMVNDFNDSELEMSPYADCVSSAIPSMPH